jgi:hypothetical protein
MCFPDEVMAQLGSRIQVVLPHLNERQRRLVLAQEARLLGHGGVRAVAQAAGVSETTVRSGVFELEAGGDPKLEAPEAAEQLAAAQSLYEPGRIERTLRGLGVTGIDLLRRGERSAEPGGADNPAIEPVFRALIISGEGWWCPETEIHRSSVSPYRWDSSAAASKGAEAGH